MFNWTLWFVIVFILKWLITLLVGQREEEMMSLCNQCVYAHVSYYKLFMVLLSVQ